MRLTSETTVFRAKDTIYIIAQTNSKVKYYVCEKDAKKVREAVEFLGW